MGTSFNLIEVANTDDPRDVAIPSPVLVGLGAEILVKDTSGGAGTNAITVTPAAGLIDGAATYDIASDSGFVMLRSDGVSWLVVGTSEVGGAPGVPTSVANVGTVTVHGTGEAGAVDITGTVTARMAVDDGSGAAGITLDATGDSGNGSIVIGGSLTTITGVGSSGLRLQTNSTKKISEYGGTGAARLAAIADSDLTNVHTKFNLLLAYLRSRGTLAP